MKWAHIQFAESPGLTIVVHDDFALKHIIPPLCKEYLCRVYTKAYGMGYDAQQEHVISPDDPLPGCSTVIITPRDTTGIVVGHRATSECGKPDLT